MHRLLAAFAFAGALSAQTIPLPDSHQLVGPVPGSPVRLNTLPMTLAVSPDGKWIASLNAGYGTVESKYMQSIALLNVATGAVEDVPEPRTLVDAEQTFYSGLVWSADGHRLYASLSSSTDPTGLGKGDTGNGIVVYAVEAGRLTPERFLKLPMVQLAAAQHTDIVARGLGHTADPFPSAIALVPGRAHETLLVAENLSDTVALLDAETGDVEFRFSVGTSALVPSAYPIALAVAKDGRRAFVALWNSSEVVELDLEKRLVAGRVALLKPASPTESGTHPCALLLDERAHMLYVALANRDAVAAVDIGSGRAQRLAARGYFDTRLPRQTYFGAEPDALAESADGRWLYAANMGSDAVAVLDTKRLRRGGRFAEAAGFIPTELMPTALMSFGGKLYIATDKGKGTGPNGAPQTIVDSVRANARFRRAFTYAPTLLHGSLATVEESAIPGQLAGWTSTVLESNRMKAAQETMRFAAGRNPIRHVIYILRENRTYDQVLGDLGAGNGDSSLTMYGASITPNQHKLAMQFGVLDNFFDSGEISGSGHVWSTAAIGSDYLEKTWQVNYRGNQRTYDFEGRVANGYPMLQQIPDVNEPASGYIWANFAAHGKSVYHFGEYVSSTFCGDKQGPPAGSVDPQLGAASGALAVCESPVYKPGAALPAEWGGGTNLWPWGIPRLRANTATKPELVGHFAAESPDFNLRVPDQIRVNVFLRHLEQWKRDRAAGHDTMPNYILLRLPNDHTAGTVPGGPTPRASVADNDLAIGRAVEAISHSAYWDDTAFFVVEDDAQNGGDHVDAHRSIALVVSKYSPRPAAAQKAFVDSRFYTTVSMIRTMEVLLGVPPMNNNDAFCSVMTPEFTGAGDQPAFNADVSNRENGLIYQANTLAAVGAKESARMDFRHADRADAAKLNTILWRDAMGEQTPPKMLLEKAPKRKDDDD